MHSGFAPHLKDIFIPSPAVYRSNFLAVPRSTIDGYFVEFHSEPRMKTN